MLVGNRSEHRLSGDRLPVGVHREPRHLTALGLINPADQHRAAQLPGDERQVLEHRGVDVGRHHHLDRYPIDDCIAAAPDDDVPVG
ncbi:hypothetical protein [Arachnia propionica]